MRKSGKKEWQKRVRDREMEIARQPNMQRKQTLCMSREIEKNKINQSINKSN